MENKLVITYNGYLRTVSVQYFVDGAVLQFRHAGVNHRAYSALMQNLHEDFSATLVENDYTIDDFDVEDKEGIGHIVYCEKGGLIVLEPGYDLPSHEIRAVDYGELMYNKFLGVVVLHGDVHVTASMEGAEHLLEVINKLRKQCGAPPATLRVVR